MFCLYDKNSYVFFKSNWTIIFPPMGAPIAYLILKLWLAEFKKERRLLQSKKNSLEENLKLSNAHFPSNNKQLPSWYLVLYIPELVLICILIHLFPMYPFLPYENIKNFSISDVFRKYRKSVLEIYGLI